jgi:hypothetical protein
VVGYTYYDYRDTLGMEGVQRQASATWLVALTLSLAVGTAAAFIWRNYDRRKTQSANELSASTALHYLSMAEADFRANDRDQNGVNDFWTADVAGLSTFGLIKPTLGLADATRWNGKDRFVPFEGYLFAALEMDASETPAVEYRQETDKKSGKVHNSAKFGFVAFPAEPDVTGRYVYIVNENATIFRLDQPRPVPKNWPTDDELKRCWRHVW